MPFTTWIRSLLWRWVLPVGGALPLIGFYIAWRRSGGWLWPLLLVASIIMVAGFGVWGVYLRPWDE